MSAIRVCRLLLHSLSRADAGHVLRGRRIGRFEGAVSMSWRLPISCTPGVGRESTRSESRASTGGHPLNQRDRHRALPSARACSAVVGCARKAATLSDGDCAGDGLSVKNVLCRTVAAPRAMRRRSSCKLKSRAVRFLNSSSARKRSVTSSLIVTTDSALASDEHSGMIRVR